MQFFLILLVQFKTKFNVFIIFPIVKMAANCAKINRVSRLEAGFQKQVQLNFLKFSQYKYIVIKNQ